VQLNDSNTTQPLYMGQIFYNHPKIKPFSVSEEEGQRTRGGILPFLQSLI
jgi:hypothetical protein